MRMGFEIENIRPELSTKEKLMEQDNLEEWFDSLPEFAKREESVDVLVLVYFVEVLNGRISGGERN